MAAQTTRKTTTTKSNVARPKSKSALNAKFRFSKSQLAIVIGLILVIGGIIVWGVLAATSQTEVETWTASGGNTKTVADNTASGGSYLEFLAPATPSGLPAGVTLQEIDGGANYFGKWANSYPTDPSYFPLSVFNVNDLGSSVSTYKSFGINTITSIYDSNGPIGNLDVAKANGMPATLGPDTEYIDNAAFEQKYGNTVAAWQYQEEGEGNPCTWITIDYLKPLCKNDPNNSGKISGASWIAMSNAVRAKDPTRPVLQGWTNGYALNHFPGGTVQELAQSSDLIYFDVYAKLDTRIQYDGYDRVWGNYTTVSNSRQFASYGKPIWPAIGPSAVDTDSGMNTSKYELTPADVKASVMQAIVAGARGIVYFKHCFCSNINKESGDIFKDSRYAPQTTAVKDVNAQITRLAPVINSPFANGYYSNTGTINSMAKYKAGDGFYIFAAAKSTSSQNVTFTVKSGSSVTVVDENRTLPIAAGKFTDIFAGETAYHIYKINP